MDGNLKFMVRDAIIRSLDEPIILLVEICLMLALITPDIGLPIYAMMLTKGLLSPLSVSK